MLIDCHVHSPKPEDLEMLNGQVAVARDHGVGAWIVNGSTVAGSREVLRYIEGRDGHFACVGIHPSQAHTFNEHSIADLAALAESDSRVVGIGEVGFDLTRSTSAGSQFLASPEQQVDAFRGQIRLARDLRLPLNLHTYGKESGDTLADILREERAWEVGGVLHNFMGGLELAHRLLDMGIYPSVSCVLMHPDARRLRGVYTNLPLGGLVMDTDWPGGVLERTGEGDYPFDLDEKTELINLARFAERLAQEKDVSLEQVSDMIEMNTLRAFPKLALALARR